MSHFRKQDRKLGGLTPYGYDSQDGQLTENAAEQSALKRMRALRHEGKSYHKIAAELNETGVKPKGSKWYPMTFKQIVNRK